MHDDDIITQTILCAEDDDLDVPTAGIIDGLILMMASYYVYHIRYPQYVKATLLSTRHTYGDARH